MGKSLQDSNHLNDWLGQIIHAPTPFTPNIKWSVPIIPGLVYFLLSLKVFQKKFNLHTSACTQGNIRSPYCAALNFKLRVIFVDGVNW